MDYLYNCKSEISNVCNTVEGHCFQAMKIVYHHANGRFDWLISGQQSVNPSKEAISVLSGKYKRLSLSILCIAYQFYSRTCKCDLISETRKTLIGLKMDLHSKLVSNVCYRFKAHRMDKGKFRRQYTNCFWRRINAQKLTNQNGHWHGDA